MKKIIAVFLLLIIVVSCEDKTKTTSSKTPNNEFISLVKYAKGFDIQVFNDFTKLIINQPYPQAKSKQEFYLYNHKKIKNKIDRKNLVIPFKNMVVTSTTHIPMIELLNQENSLIGFPNTKYITSAKTSELVEKGKIKDIGNEQEFNTEILLALQPDVIIGFSMENTSNLYRTIEKNGIPVIYNSDWLEETPLGRAEWIKFFGVLFNKNKEADSIFRDIEKRYLAAKKIAAHAKNTPTVFTGMLFKDKWNLPAGDSFMAQFYKDANVNYLWKNTKGKGSLVLSFESVLNKASEADYWIGTGYFNNFKEMSKANKHYTKFKAFKQKEVYSFSNKRGKNGGVIYFELAPIQPHIVLKDLIKITHPELLPNYQPFFIEKLK